MFRVIGRRFINEALLQGETRSLSLHGAHQRQRSKADSKSIHGTDLRSALNPFEDSTFTFSSARAQVDEDTHSALVGVVGTTPTRSQVWNRRVESFGVFRSAIAEILHDLAAAMRGDGLEQPFPLLATEVDSLTGVLGAYEVAVPGSEEARGLADSDDDSVAAAELLERAQLIVIGDPASADFKLDVGFGASAGVLAVHVTYSHDTARFDLGVEGQPSDPVAFVAIRQALAEHPDMLTAYYSSGHAIGNDKITRPVIRAVPFPNWEWWPVGMCDVTKEKPAGDGIVMHQNIGQPGDRSIFGWVVRNIGPGWLTCDDGAGEVADFVHLAPDNKLTLVPVKAAYSGSLYRGVSASAFEVVVGQATKNIAFLDRDELHARLSVAHAATRATWHEGVRQADRSGFLAALAARPRSSAFGVKIVQPHVRKERYIELQDASTHASEDYLRLKRLETLLNSTRGSVVGVGGDLRVVGAG
jgi:hypothetical protein